MKTKRFILLFLLLIAGFKLSLLVFQTFSFNQGKIEIEIQKLFKEQQKAINQLNKSPKENKLEQIRLAKEKNLRILELNQTLITHASKKQRQALEERQALLETGLEMFKKAEECLNLANQESESEQKLDLCHQELMEVSQKIAKANKKQ